MFSQTLLLGLLMQFLMLGFAVAEEMVGIEGSSHGNSWQYGAGGGVVGFIVLILDIIVWIEVLKSNRPPLSKVIWCLVVFLFPIIGLVVYWLFSNRDAHNSGSGYESIA